MQRKTSVKFILNWLPYIFCITLFIYTQIISPNRVLSIWRNVDRFWLTPPKSATASSFQQTGLQSRSPTCQNTLQTCSKCAVGVKRSRRIHCGICSPPTSQTLIQISWRLRRNSWHTPLTHLKQFTLRPVRKVRFYFLQFFKLVYFILNVFSRNVCKIFSHFHYLFQNFSY